MEDHQKSTKIVEKTKQDAETGDKTAGYRKRKGEEG